MTLLPLLIACTGKSDQAGDTADTGTSAACTDTALDLSGMHEDPLVLHAGCTYVVHDGASTHAAVTVEPGAVVAFDPGATLDFYAGLDVEGTADAPAVFRGRDAGAGTWPGITLHATDTGAYEIHHLEIDGGGMPDSSTVTQTAGSAGLNVEQDQEVLVDGLTVTGSAAYGLLLWGTLASGSDGISVPDAELGSVYVGSDSLGTLPAIDTALPIYVDGIGIKSSATWVSQPVPLDFEWGSAAVESGTLTIEPNTILFGPDVQLAVGGNDVADLVATDVTFDASDPSVGWGGVFIYGQYTSATSITGGKIANGSGPEYDYYSDWISGVVTVDTSDVACAQPTISDVEIVAGANAETCIVFVSGCTDCPAAHYEGEGRMTCSTEEFYYDQTCAP